MFTIDTKLNELRLAIVSNPLVVNPNERVIDAIAQMIVVQDKGNRLNYLEQLHLKTRSSCVLVVEDGQAIGILTERDVVRLTIERQPLDRLLMHEVMRQPIVTVSAEESLNTVQQLMEQRDIHRLVVIGEQNELVGIVTQTLLLQFLNLPELVKLKAEALMASQRNALEESNALLVRTSEDLRCTIEELRSSTEELIEKQHHLEDEQIRYHNLFTFSPDGYLVTDASSNIKEANQAILNQLAISHEFIRDKPFIVFVAPNQSEIFHSRLNHLLTSVIINANWETTLVSRQGNSFPVEITVTKNISLATKEIQFFWIVRDISDRKHAQKALQQQLSAMEAAIDGIAILQENTYIYLNQAHLEMFGYKNSEELIGKSWTLLYAPEELARFEREVFPVLGRERSWQGEAIAIRKDGTTFTEGLSLTLTEDDLLICVCRDISDRKQAQQQLIETNQQLAISNQELARTTRHKDEFLANMSHELRTPLNSILGITEGLMDEVFGLLSEEQKRILPIIERSGNHLLELINDILDLSKIEAGKLVLDCSLTDVNRLCQSSIMFVKQQSMQKKLHLIMEVAPFLPEMMIDERRIRQVLINLLNNAVKFTPDGGQITLEVMLESVNAASDGVMSENNPTHWLHFAVIDTGIGIAPEALKNLFQPFVQIDSALNRQYDGAGLGLALVKRIVELHHGYVNVTSELDIGSRFTISLPYDSTSIPLPQALPKLDSEAIASTNDSTDSSPLILLAEDNEANILTISSYLEAKGYRLIIAKNGLEAINLVLSEQPNLVLMDIQMPGMDGLEAIKRIRAQNLIDVPIVAVTALAMEGDREKCLAAGANEYLSKPIKLKQLATLIQQFL
jgi:PAS domain S-box-containing protein